MSKRLNQDREAKLQPLRIKTAVDELNKLGFSITYIDNVKIQFVFNGSTITYYPYSGWASGKTIRDGRGLKNLLNQLNEQRETKAIRIQAETVRHGREVPRTAEREVKANVQEAQGHEGA